jgi:hypothetical protein
VDAGGVRARPRLRYIPRVHPASPSDAGLIAAGRALPAWMDALLDQSGPDQHGPDQHGPDQHSGGGFFASRLWFDTLLAHAMPDGATALLAVNAGRVAALPLLRRAGRLSSLTGPYSLAWRPLHDRRAEAASVRLAMQAIARSLRPDGPITLELIDPALPSLPGLVAGLRRGRMLAAPFDHVGNWHETLGEAGSWADYLAARPPALRTTIQRKLSRADRTARFEAIDTPGQALEAGIVAYEDVRARSWKPQEPFPGFDAALLRATAAAGVLRLGVLREAAGSRAIAAQYWVLDRTEAGLRRATVLKLAHDEAARAASPGTVLTAMMIRRLIEEDAVRVLDFGRGDDPYKQLWAGARRQRIGLVVADPLSPRGLAALARQWAGPALRRLAGR